MPLAWNEIRQRAIKFANEWSAARSESADKQTFWNEFFNVFGLARKTVASFETPVKKVSGHDGSIDLFWKGLLLVEHKSRGGHLGKAQSQAFDYIQALASEGRHNEIPRYVIVADFARIVLYDLEPEEQKDLPLFLNKRVQIVAEFALQDFHKNIRPFAFIAGYKQQKLDPEDPANLEAAKIMANLHDALKAGNYGGHELRVFLVRILFCLFAEDTWIFPQPRQFELYLLNHTAKDGSDLGMRLGHLFEIMNTPVENRQKHLEEDLAEFPYINGALFAERLISADFNSDMRNALLGACAFRWEKISPAVFGSLFQEVMQPKERRQLGAHYTSEKNIMKVVRSLFLDDLRAEVDAIKNDKSTRRSARLDEFHAKLAGLRFFDPACGCGNFLVITYRELRTLELEVLNLIHGKQQEMTLDQVNKLSLLDVDQMFGIELEEFPARIAEVALWLTDHQANMELSIAFTQRYIRIPLRKSPHIHVGNALRMDWNRVLQPTECSYVLGNPPFVGKKEQTSEQKNDMAAVWGALKQSGVLDYVSAWYKKAAEYIEGTGIAVGFVSTNSITQGEQVGVLWPTLFNLGISINFAHRTFPWTSEARGKAHVHVVIIGFGWKSGGRKTLLDYEASDKDAIATVVTNISPYLIEGSNVALQRRDDRLDLTAPEMMKGSEVTDDGHLLLTSTERDEIVRAAPSLKAYIRKFTGGREFINGQERWCLWLRDAAPSDYRNCELVLARLEKVRQFRLQSPKPRTVELAAYPAVFGEDRQPDNDYLLIPKVSSERRSYIPIGFLPPKVIASGSSLVVPLATIFHFGVISSRMHMAWMRQVCGRMKSDYQYSVNIVYNNFPWPQSPTDAQRDAVEKAAQAVLDARGKFTGSTLADLYDPLTIPHGLAKAHADLDRTVDRCYRKEPFSTDRARVEFLFSLYEKLTAPLIALTKKPKRKKGAYNLPAPPPPAGTNLTREQAWADSAHFYSAKEEGPPYGSKPDSL